MTANYCIMFASDNAVGRGEVQMISSWNKNIVLYTFKQHQYDGQ